MAQIITLLQHYKADKRGVTALEYGLIAAVIAAVAAGAFGGIGTNLNTVLGTVNTAL